MCVCVGEKERRERHCVCVFVCLQELRLKVQELTNQVLSLEVVIKEVNQQLSDKRHLHHTETQRMAAQSQQQQSRIASLQSELGRLQGVLASQQQSSGLQTEIESLWSELSRAQNQLATQQQNYELRLTSLTTQTNMARQDQVQCVVYTPLLPTF